MGILLIEPGNGEVFAEHNAYEAAHFSKSYNENMLHCPQDTIRELKMHIAIALTNNHSQRIGVLNVSNSATERQFCFKRGIRNL
jgi:hypothetical protein